ncbi:hypothetical protein ACFSBZ_12995 [Amnibacterium flavum]|uniref:hypothetical protein n=1 Tax=Amnibacterium flavum TaxID=2173173 RepID=UPI001057BDE4|nr:hypothetical protein [Amnibacterium flavum]
MTDSARDAPDTTPADDVSGLRLRWPDAVTQDPDLDALVIDVVNTGSEVWRPASTRLLVVGALLAQASDSGGFSFGYVGGAGDRIPLGPGEYARVPVRLAPFDWSSAVPGPHLVRAALVAPGLVVDPPLVVELTQERIDRVRSEQAPDPAVEVRHRRRLDEQLSGLRAMLTASERLGDVAAAVASASDEEDGVARIAAVLGCGPDAARQVFGSPLHRLRSSSSLDAEVARVLRRMEGLPDPENP